MRVLWVLGGLAVLLVGWLLWADARSARGPEGPREPDAATVRAPTPTEHLATEDRSAEDEPGRTAVADAGPAITGIVVDGRRRPVAAAVVTALSPHGSLLKATAGADGRFRIGPIVFEEKSKGLSLGARAPNGEAGAVSATVFRDGSAPDVRIVVGPASPLHVLVLVDGTPAAGAQVLLVGGAQAATTGEEGAVSFDYVPDGLHEVRAGRGDDRRGVALVSLPRAEAGPVRVDLVPTWTARIRVVTKGDGAPVPGAVLQLMREIRTPRLVTYGEPLLLPPVAGTDANGRTAIAGIHPEERLVVVRVDAPGRPPGPASSRNRVPLTPTADETTIEIPALVTLRFPVVDGKAPPPPDGATIELRAMPGSGAPDPPPTGRMEGNRLVVERAVAGHFSAIAAAPDGAVARLYVSPQDGEARETSFVPAGAVTVVVRDAAGRPAAGEWVGLRQQGNNPVAPPAATDETGTVRFTGLWPEQLDVYLLPNREVPYGGHRGGSVNLVEGDGQVVVTAGEIREIIVRARVEGEPGLPGSLWLPRGAEEDPERGEFRYRERLAPGQTRHALPLHAAGFLPVQSMIEVPPKGPLVHEVEFRRGGEIRVLVRKPEDGRVRIALAPEHGDARRTPVGIFNQAFVERPDGSWLLSGVPPGRYRVADVQSRIRSEPFEVAAGVESRVAFDLSRAGWVEGRLEAPEGTDLRAARILVEGEGIEEQRTQGFDQNASPPREDGSFMVRVPGDRPVTIRAWHPSLVAGPAGAIRLTAPETGVVLRLEKGASCVLRLSPAPKTGFGTEPRVLLFRGEPEGEPVGAHPLLLTEGRASFAGFEPGSYTLWIDVPGFAPAVRRGVTLGAEETDLGAIALSAGSTIRVRILVPDGESPPRIHLFATREGSPSYSRGLNSGTQEVVELSGLGPGRFRVQASPIMGGGTGAILDATLDLDGVSSAELTMDLRK